MAARALAGKDVEEDTIYEVRERRGRTEFGEQENGEDNKPLRKNIKFCVCFVIVLTYYKDFISWNHNYCVLEMEVL